MEKEFTKRVNWYYFVKTTKKEEIEKALEKNKIETRRAFIPMHMQPLYKGIAKGDFPVSERLLKEGLYLPTFPDLTKKEQDTIIKIVLDCFK